MRPCVRALLIKQNRRNTDKNISKYGSKQKCLMGHPWIFWALINVILVHTHNVKLYTLERSTRKIEKYKHKSTLLVFACFVEFQFNYLISYYCQFYWNTESKLHDRISSPKSSHGKHLCYTCAMTDYVAGKYEGIVDPAAEAFWLQCGMDPKMAKEFVGAKVCWFFFSVMVILWFQCNFD